MKMNMYVYGLISKLGAPFQLWIVLRHLLFRGTKIWDSDFGHYPFRDRVRKRDRKREREAGWELDRTVIGF